MRIGRAVLGVLLLLLGLLLAAAGAVGIAAFGTDGTIRVTSTPLATEPDGYALVHDVVGVSAGFPGSQSLGSTTIGARSNGGERLFIGLGATEDVNTYLSGVPYEAIHQDGTTWTADPVPGPDQPNPPEDEDFWIRQSSGNDPAIEFTGSRGAATFVVMNADASKGVDALITIGYTSATVFPLSLGAAVVGVVLAVLGLLLLLRSRRRPAASAAEPAPPPPAATPEGVGAGTTAPVTPAPSEPGSEQLPDEWFREQDSTR